MEGSWKVNPRMIEFQVPDDSATMYLTTLINNAEKRIAEATGAREAGKELLVYGRRVSDLMLANTGQHV